MCTDHKCNIETWCRVDIRTLEHFTSCNKTLTRGPEPSELELIRPGARRRISLGSSLVTLAHLHTLHIQHTGGKVSYFCNFCLQNVMVEMNRKIYMKIFQCVNLHTPQETAVEWLNALKRERMCENVCSSLTMLRWLLF